MRIRIHLQAIEFRRGISAPDARRRNKETLLGSEAVNRRMRFARNGFFQRAESDGHSAKIRYAFAENQFSVLMQIAGDNVAVKLFGYTVSALLKIFRVFRRPPIAQV